MKASTVISAVRAVMEQAPLSCIVAILCFLGFLINLLSGWRSAEWLGLHVEDLAYPLHWYRLLTYAVLHGSVFHWFWNALLVIAIGVSIERRITRWYIASMVVVSSLMGGILFCIFAHHDNVLIGAGFILDAYIGCLFACYLADKPSFHKHERIITTALATLKLIGIGVGLAWIAYGMNTNILKLLVLLLSFCVSWIMYSHIAEEKLTKGSTRTGDPLRGSPAG